MSKPLTAHPRPYHLEASGGVEFTLHHVEEDGDGGFAKLCLWNQRHFQYGTNHLWNELDLVLTLNKEMHYSTIFFFKKKDSEMGFSGQNKITQITRILKARIWRIYIHFSPTGNDFECVQPVV